MANQEDDRSSRPDEENPEWREQNFRSARPALELIAETFGAHMADALSRKRGRPVKNDKKVSQNMRFDRDVLEAYQSEGRGWQTRMNQVLREHMPGEQKYSGSQTG